MGVEGIGASVVRREDRRFITGKGRYVDDIKLVGLTHAHFIRSPHAHARIKSIDTSEAMKMPGVVGVLIGQELVDGGGEVLRVEVGEGHQGVAPDGRVVVEEELPDARQERTEWLETVGRDVRVRRVRSVAVRATARQVLTPLNHAISVDRQHQTEIALGQVCPIVVLVAHR